MSNIIDDPIFLLPANGQIVSRPIGGDFLLCATADQKFKMSLDGSKYFVFNQGLKLRGLRAKGVNKIWAMATAGVDTNVQFYIGDVEADDSRLSIIHDANQVLAVSQKIPPTYQVCSNFFVPAAVGPANGQKVILGVNAGQQRKDIYIDNLDGASVLYSGNVAGALGKPIYPQSGVVLETNDTIYLYNNTAADIAVMVTEIYYAP